MLKSRCLKLYNNASIIFETIVDERGRACPIRLLEFYFPKEIKNYAFHIEDDLSDEQSIKIDGKTEFSPHPRITIDSKVYDLALSYDGPSVFSCFHEACHLIHHRYDPRVENVISLNRGTPGSGTSFLKYPEFESEANFWASAIMVPIDAINKNTKPEELVEKFGVSKEVANISLKQARAIFPDKWAIGR